MARALGEQKVDLLVDVGTGTGRILQLFAHLAKSAIGVDASHKMLAIARARMEQLNAPNVQVRHGDVYDLPFDPDTVDTLIIHQVLHYLDNPQAALAEAARVLRPGGRLLIVDFAPHELEFLRDEQAHRRLGIAGALMEDWLARCHLQISDMSSLPPDVETDSGLTVSLWVATKTTP